MTGVTVRSATPGPQGAAPKPAGKTAQAGPAEVKDAGVSGLLALLKIEADARAANSEKELIYLIANETRKLTRARQVFVMRRTASRKWRVIGVNSVDAVVRDAPVIHWVERMVMRLRADAGLGELREFSLPAYCDETETETRTYPFRAFIWCPLKLPGGDEFAGLLLARETPWIGSDTAVVERLSATFAHAWRALTGQRRLKRAAVRPSIAALCAVLALVSVMMLPVPMTALAPAEIVPKDPFIVAAPIDGVIDQVVVEPNAPVEPGELLARFDDTALRNRLEVAERDLALAQAKLKRHGQAAFDDPEARRELRTALAELELKRSERDYARDLLDKTSITAPRAGLAVFADRKDWAGRPVSVGERVMQIADPGRYEIAVRLPVEDAIVLRTGARVKLYLDSDPLDPREAVIVKAGHEAAPDAAGTLAYRVTAELADKTAGPLRLGIRGTAQLYGEQATLFLYLFRRPLSALRQRIGL